MKNSLKKTEAHRWSWQFSLFLSRLLRCLWTLRRRFYSLHPPSPTQFLACSSLLTAPRGNVWQQRRERQVDTQEGRGREREERDTWGEWSMQKNKIYSQGQQTEFLPVFHRRERTLTYTFIIRSRRQELFYITFLSSWFIFPLFFFVCFVFNQGRGSKESINQQLRTLTVHSTISTASLFQYTWQTLQPKTTLISFWLFCFWLFVNVPRLVLIMFSCIPSLLSFPPVFPLIFWSFFMKESQTVYRPPALSTSCHFLTVLEAWSQQHARRKKKKRFFF